MDLCVCWTDEKWSDENYSVEKQLQMYCSTYENKLYRVLTKTDLSATHKN